MCKKDAIAIAIDRDEEQFTVRFTLDYWIVQARNIPYLPTKLGSYKPAG